MTEKQYLKIQDRLCKETMLSIFADTITYNLLFEFYAEKDGDVVYDHAHDFTELLGMITWYVYDGYKVILNDTCEEYSPFEFRCVQEWIEYLENLSE